MTEHEDFTAWTTELIPVGLIKPRQSIETAQILQENIFLQPWEQQLTAGIDALGVLSEVHYDVTGRNSI